MSRTMKDCGIPWIGEIPSHWKISRVKNYFFRKNEKAHQDNPTILSLARSGVRVRDISTNEGQMAESYFDYNPVAVNDLLINPMDLYSGANCSISKVKGVISPAYVNLRNKNGAVPRYFDYYFKTQYWAMAFFAHGRGISFDNRWTLGVDTLFNYYIPVPCPQEQQAIADFLDEKCGEIDEMISLQEKIVEELKAYKQSIITEAVCKGLDPNVPLKDSGIEWVGQIPDKWRITKISRIARTNSGSTPKSISDGEESNITWIRTTDINDCIVSNSSLHLTKEEQMSASCPMLDIGTCVVAMYGGAGTIGKSGILGTCATINQALCSMEVYDSYCSNYLFCVLRAVRSFWMKYAVGTRKDPNINQEIVRNMKIPFPPLNEQQAIADYLDTKCAEIDALISLKQSKIDALKEYKKSIIYEYITGKKEIPYGD